MPLTASDAKHQEADAAMTQPNDRLASETIHSLKWTYSATMIVAVFQIIYAVVMARLLPPAAFGLLGMAGVVLRFGAYFATMGVGPALIQKREVTEGDIRSSFGFSVTLGVAVYAVFWLAAPIAARLFADPQVVPVVRVMALGMVLEGFYITSLSLLRRQMRFKTLAAIDIFAYACVNLVVAVSLALYGLGVWSLVLSTLAQNAVAALLYYLAVRHPLRPSYHWRTYRGLARYGGRFSLISFMQFLYYSIQPLFIGRYFGATYLGYFTSAQRIANLPFDFLIGALNRVLFPSFSRAQTEIVRMKRMFMSSFTIIAIIFFPVAYGMIPAAKEIVLTLLGPQWTASIGIVQILLVAVPFSFLNSMNGVSIDANGHLTFKIKVDGAAIATMLVLAAILSVRQKLLGVVMIYSMLEMIRFAIYLASVVKLLDLQKTDLHPIAIAVLRNTLAVVLAVSTVQFIVMRADTPTILALVAQVVIGAVVFMVVTFVRSSVVVKQEIERIYVKLAPTPGQDTRRARLTQWLARNVLCIETA